ncbi:MAG: 3-phosphoshikimate 1-carboxyvinyltransferase [Spirochaetia bacterium]
MKAVIRQSRLSGTMTVPPSKSHTIRAVFIASLADGTSEIIEPLASRDTEACIRVWKALGAEIEQTRGRITVRGTGGRIRTPDDILDTGNSGTTLFFALSAAALGEGWSFFTGDAQIRKRSAAPLLEALNRLGAEAFSSRGSGCAPAAVRGPLKGGKAEISCSTSQYLSSLLISLPLAENDSVISVPLLNEKPYVDMTLRWLEETGIETEKESSARFMIKGGQSYRSFRKRIPGDFSSASFFLCAAAITGSELTLQNLDPEDSQGDRRILDILSEMGASWTLDDSGITLKPGGLAGGDFDINDIPDALPILAVTACFADGETRLLNVPQAREKETDRIAVMAAELSKMGASVRELPDGLVIRQSALRGAEVNGHGDHRAVMALSAAGLAAPGETVILTAESAAVTFPDFFSILADLTPAGAVNLEKQD